MIDDYGHSRGPREAVEEYFESNRLKILLSRTDYKARMGVALKNKMI